MKILVLTDRFHPEVSAPSVRILEHARVWVEEGHEVTVVTSAPNAPRGVVFDGYENKVFQEEWIDGIRTIRLWSYMTANEGFVRRVLDYQSLMLSTVAMCWRFGDFDVVLASSPPLFTAMAGYAVAKLRRKPWVFEVRDIWPASIRATAASDSTALLDLLEKLELWLYAQSDRIVVVTHAFVDDLVSRGVPASKIDVVTNGVNTDQFDRAAVDVDARAELGVASDVFLAGYIGTTGMAHGLDTVLDAAKLCADEPKIQWLILGEGAERASLEERARRENIANVRFHDFVPHEQIPRYHAAINASIVHLRPDPLFEGVIPSKIFECMSMGVPIVMAVPGEAQRMVAEAGAGVSIPSGDAQALADAVRRLAAEPETCAALSDGGRRAAREKYGRRAKAKALLQSLRRARGAR